MLNFSIKGFCHICNKPLRFKVYEKDDFIFCRKHLGFYSAHHFIELKEYFFHAEDEKAALLEDTRLLLFNDFKIPTIQRISYQEDNGKLITKTKIFSLKDDQDKLFKKLEEVGL